MQDSSLVTNLISISIKAGEILLKHHRNNSFDVEIKSDDSPVTLADKEADLFITEELSKISDLKIISEEGSKKDLPTDSDFWLVDPLDGTKNFIKGGSEFTVNIGLIENNQASLGVIYQPVKDKLWFTSLDKKSYFFDDASKVQLSNDFSQYNPIKTSNKSFSDSLIVVASASHLSKKTEEYLKQVNVKSFKPAASSLKFCLVADATADFYPRLSPTMQWDTAAGHAILKGAGGSVVNPDGSEFKYVIDAKDFESLRNGHFIARGWN